MLQKKEMLQKKIIWFIPYGLLTLTGCNKVMHHAAQPNENKVHAKKISMTNTVINERNTERNTLYGIVFNGGGLVDIKRSLNSGASVYESDTDGWNALHHAVAKDHLEIVAELLDWGADVNALTNNNKTPLHLATENGRQKIVQILLLSKNIQVDITDANAQYHNGMTALCYAVYYGHLDIVKLLIDRGADIHCVIPIRIEGRDSTISLLGMAVTREQWDIAKLLIEKGATDINCMMPITIKGRDSIISLLGWAAYNRQWDIVKLLIERGANINCLMPTKIDERYTDMPLLGWAATRGQWDIAKLLIERGADINFVIPIDGRDSIISLLELSAYNQQWDLAKLLIEKGADINFSITVEIGGRDRTIPLLGVVTCRKQWDIANLLIERGADINCLMPIIRDGKDIDIPLLEFMYES